MRELLIWICVMSLCFASCKGGRESIVAAAITSMLELVVAVMFCSKHHKNVCVNGYLL